MKIPRKHPQVGTPRRGVRQGTIHNRPLKTTNLRQVTTSVSLAPRGGERVRERGTLTAWKIDAKLAESSACPPRYHAVFPPFSLQPLAFSLFFQLSQ
jgi:hypothetical protein